jgi:hypothetical protein
LTAATGDLRGTGRPLRLLLLLALGLGVWVMLRLPIMQRDAAQARRAMAPGGDAPAPLRLVSAAGGVGPGGVAPGGGVDLAVAQAEYDVAAAELGVARARLRLAQIQQGGVYVPLPQQMPVAAPPVAVVLAARRVDTAPREYAGRRDDGWSLPPRAPVRQVALASPTPVVPAVPAALPPGHDPGTTDDPRRAEWAAERRRLGRRWSADAFALIRDGGPVGPAASPVLGGGQSGGGIAWTLDPLARKPIAVVARFNAASDVNGGIDNSTSQAAFGVRWRPVKGVSISAERLVAIGIAARNDWALRVAGGADGKRGRIEWNGYGEAGVLGVGDVFAGAQARAGLPVLRLTKASFLAGAGAWGSFQTGGVTTGRFDMGPTLVMRAPMGRTNVEVSADWRFRLVGNAMPGSGPALTVSTGF